MIALIVINFCPLTMLFCGLLSFISNWNHLVNTLLSLEFLMLSIFLIMSLNMSEDEIEIYMMFVFNSSCLWGGISWSLLISVVRSHGNDYFKSFSLL